MAEEKQDTTGFGARLKELREAAGLTRKQLGELTDILEENIARWERGDRSPSWKTVLKLADALGVEPNDFRPPADPPAGGRAGTERPRPKGK